MTETDERYLDAKFAEINRRLDDLAATAKTNAAAIQSFVGACGTCRLEVERSRSDILGRAEAAAESAKGAHARVGRVEKGLGAVALGIFGVVVAWAWGKIAAP